MAEVDAGPYWFDLIGAGCRTRKAGLRHYSLASSLFELAFKLRVIDLTIHSKILEDEEACLGFLEMLVMPNTTLGNCDGQRWFDDIFKQYP